jgi:hypothetical protein
MMTCATRQTYAERHERSRPTASAPRVPQGAAYTAGARRRSLAANGERCR